MGRLRERETRLDEASLGALRARAGLTQHQVAQRMGISQSDVSKLERRADVRISTLEAYVRAIGRRFACPASSPTGARCRSRHPAGGRGRAGSRWETGPFEGSGGRCYSGHWLALYSLRAARAAAARAATSGSALRRTGAAFRIHLRNPDTPSMKPGFILSPPAGEMEGRTTRQVCSTRLTEQGISVKFLSQ
ncbi:MAG: helix-turn-helix domain-containing protein [Actinomycetota bacterium]